ncbi:MAG: Gfo/Idh/MocA family oxidoreductase [Ardenticatenaceae bacterium]|nr:Gfo/Idh/MocA family oxidoreductase [Ardenticatenaceae bacterium]
MAKQPLRLAIVGCGDIAQYVTRFARLNRRIQLAAACDVSADRAEAFARRFKIPQTFTDYAAMLEQAELDAVYLAVPHHLHGEMMATAVAHHTPVFTEKPVTRTLAEGQKIAQLAAAQGIKIGVNYQYRYDSGCHRLARAVQNGDLGAVHSVRINIPWHRKADYFDHAAWHSKIATAGGGTLLTQGSHFLDVVLWALAGDDPVTAVGYTAQRKFKTSSAPAHRGKDTTERIEVEDLAQGIIQMASGALIQISSSMVASSEQATSIEVYGERATAVYSPSPLPHVKFRDAPVKAPKPPHRGIHALQRSLEGFRAWVMDDVPYLTPAPSALPVLAAVEAIYRSAQSEKREEIEDWRLENRENALSNL